VVGYVSDARKAKVFVPEDQKWAMTDWAPQAVAAGLKRMAMVTAETGLAKSSAEDVSKQIDQHGRSMRTFDSIGVATVWAQTGLTEPKPAER
jgi:hypothetical protein